MRVLSYLLLKQKNLKALQAAVDSLSPASLHLWFETLMKNRNESRVSKAESRQERRASPERSQNTSNITRQHERHSTFLLAFASSKSWSSFMVAAKVVSRSPAALAVCVSEGFLIRGRRGLHTSLTSFEFTPQQSGNKAYSSLLQQVF